MRRAIVSVGLSLLAGQTASSPRAETAPVGTSARANAVVDAAGRVVPAAAEGRSPEVIGRPPPAACRNAAALPAEEAKALVARVARQEGFYPDFVLSVAKIESRYVSTALSEKGAYGLMQLEPDTARRFAVDLCDPEGNVRGGIRLLRTLHARYRNPFFILAAYNAGEDAVRRSRGVPPYPETVRFVADVMNDFYVWPAASAGRTDAPVLASAAPSGATPSGIVEVDATPPAASPTAPAANAAPPSSPPPPSAPAPSWSAGFVLHVQ